MFRLGYIINIFILFLVILYFFCNGYYPEYGYVYPLDDAYIHLSIAENFANYGIWGIDQYSFSSTTSSPLYTFTLSLFIKLFGINDYYPLLINLLLLLIYLYFSIKIIEERVVQYKWLVFTALIWLPKVYLQVLTGMEHMLQLVLIIVLLKSLLSYTTNNLNKYFIQICILSAILFFVRYESIFLIFSIFLLILTKSFKHSLVYLSVSISLITIYGIWSIFNGSYFFPNTIILKGLGGIGKDDLMARISLKSKVILTLSILIGYLFILIKTINYKSFKQFLEVKNKLPIFLVIFITLSLNFAFIRFEQLFRYDSNLILLGVTGLIILYRKTEGNKVFLNTISFTILLIGLIPLSHSFLKMRYANANIKNQQIQMAEFINKHYNNSVIGANDIGAISYKSNIKLIDYVGLGNIEVAEIRLKNFLHVNETIKHKEIIKLGKEKKLDILVIYDEWFEAGIPEKYIKVAEWSIENNVVCGNETVSFYSVKSENTKELRESLIEFSESKKEFFKLELF